MGDFIKKIDAGILVIASMLVCFTLITFIANPLIAFAGISAVASLCWLCFKPVRLIYAEIIYSSCYSVLVSDFSFPSIISYGTDILNILALLFAIKKFLEHKSFYFQISRLFIGLFFIFVFFGVLSGVGHGESAILILWAMRMFLRGPMFLFSCFMLLDDVHVKQMIRLVVGLFVICIFLSLIQYFVYGYSGDLIGGIYGTKSGGNGGLNSLIVYVTVIALFGMLYKKISAKLCLFVVLSSLFVSSLAELKVYYLEFAAILLMLVVLGKNFLKNMITVIFGLAGLSFGLNMIYTFSPNVKGFLDPSEIMLYTTSEGYGASGVNRGNGISVINDTFLDSFMDKLFGLGLGSGQTNQFFESSLFKKYGETYHWVFFSDTWILLETGFVGLATFILIILLSGLKCYKLATSDIDNRWLLKASMCLSVLSIVLLWYNQTAVSEPCYLMFFILSIPYVLAKSKCSNFKFEIKKPRFEVF